MNGFLLDFFLDEVAPDDDGVPIQLHLIDDSLAVAALQEPVG